MGAEEFSADIPCLANENTRYPDKSGKATGLMNPATAPKLWGYDAAAGAALLCAGSCFHSVAGKTSVLWTGEELEAAKAWAEGARSVRLHWQDGAYRHPASAETHDLLRVYDRVNGDGSFERVEIRK
jgi:hypothetical protein